LKTIAYKNQLSINKTHTQYVFEPRDKKLLKKERKKLKTVKI